MWEKMRKCYPPQLELLALLLVILTFYIALSNYSLLPDTIPSHFDASGNPDELSGKGTIWVLPIISAVFFLLFTFIYFLLAVVDDPRQFINLPVRKSTMEAMSEEQVEKLRVFVTRSLFVLKIISMGFFVYMTWQTVEVAQGRASDIGTAPWLFGGVITVICGYVVWKSYRIVKTST